MIKVGSGFKTANAVLAKQPIYRLQIESYGRTFVWIPKKADGTYFEPLVAGEYPWIEGLGDLSISVSDLDGGADLGTLSITVLDVDGKITADLPGSLLEGKVATLTTGFPGMLRADYATLFVGVVDTIVGANDNLSYVFNCVDTSQVLSKVIYNIGDSGFATDSNNPRTLNGHPLDILTSLLTDEVGLELPDINVGKLFGYRDGAFAGVQFSFSIDSPPSAKDFIENEILKPLGGYHFTNSKGQFDVNFFYPITVVLPYAGALIGAWVDGTGQLITAPFVIGNGVNKKVPAGTVALQMGVNDSFYTDNAGSWDVSVNGAATINVGATYAPYGFGGGINGAYPGTFTGAHAPTSTPVTAGTTISIELLNYDDSLAHGVSIHGSVGVHFRDGYGEAGTPSPAGSPGIWATPAVVFKIPVMDLTVDNTLEIPLAEQVDLVNVVLFRFDKNSQGTFLAQDLEKYQKSIDRFGQVGSGQLYGQQIIESEGMRSGLQGFFLAAFTSRMIFLRYGLKNLMYEGVPHLWTTCLLEPGDIVRVTNKFVPDRAAGIPGYPFGVGIVAKYMEVMDRDWNFEEGTVTLKLLDATYLQGFGSALITKDSQGTFAASSADDRITYMFLANDSDKYSTGDAAQLLG